MCKIMYFVYKLLYKIKCLRKYMVFRMARYEGGEVISSTLRDYAESHNVKVGMYTYGFCFSEKFNLGGRVTIGRYCSIAENVRYFGANHPLKNVSTSAYFYNSALGLNVADVERNKLVVGNDVWIGYGVVITSGCKRIGNGAVIGAGSVVTKDVEPYSVVAGNPAKVIKYRFSPEVIEKIECSEWWNYKPEELFRYYEYMHEPIKFVEELMRKDKIK